MRLRFLKNWRRNAKPGTERVISDGVANLLIKRGLAVEVKDEPETAAIEPEMERAVKPKAMLRVKGGQERNWRPQPSP
jgi:hypothetical protein